MNQRTNEIMIHNKENVSTIPRICVHIYDGFFVTQHKTGLYAHTQIHIDMLLYNWLIVC